MSGTEFLKFTKVKSTTDHTFWAKFAELKVDKLKLDEKTAVPLWASYNLEPSSQAVNQNNNRLSLDCTSFNENCEAATRKTAVTCHGYMVNTNTFDTFRKTDPEKFLDALGRSSIDSIKETSILKEPWKLSTFLVLAYSDLKKFRFHYWVAYPTPFSLPEIHEESSPILLREIFTTDQWKELSDSFLELDSKSKNFFSVIIDRENKVRVSDLEEGIACIGKKNESREKAADQEKIYFAFYDPCITQEPGWPLRNLLCLLYWHCPSYSFKSSMNIISVRGNRAQDSVIYTLRTKSYCEYGPTREAIFQSRLVGWEMNANGKMGPNIADLSDTMDPSKLSDRAINLNLKLMKWRLVPDLDLEKVSALRCLLLGAGTLGCSVARVLIGWGVNHITFVDGSNVSHSNTVRQSLYSHQDAVERRFKAHAARDALLNIRPSLNAKGEVLHIPMPGHVLGPSTMKPTEEAFGKLEELIEENDVVFLLLDSREARWLPTLLCAAKNKMVINAALGFDTFTVQRHGTRDSSDTEPPPPDLTARNPIGADLGCYFCNDVTQPGNSQTDRTLDQQCTVSRPGLSQIAAGLAVELLVAVMQHPNGMEARALTNDTADTSKMLSSGSFGLLGGIPHTIRGYLWNYELQLTVTQRFPACTACSAALIQEYKARGFSFIVDACNTPNYLERLSGLEDILKRPELDELCYALDSSSDENNDDDDDRPNDNH